MDFRVTFFQFCVLKIDVSETQLKIIFQSLNKNKKSNFLELDEILQSQELQDLINPTVTKQRNTVMTRRVCLLLAKHHRRTFFNI